MKMFIAGHRGMAGSALHRHLQKDRPDIDVLTRSRDELDLTDQSAVRAFLQSEKPDEVIVAAGKVGGIHANNTYPYAFIYENLMIELNTIQASFEAGVERLLFLGSSCIYPKMAPQPMTEDALLTGYLEPTNQPYAVAKIAGIKLCESLNREHGTDYRSVMPTNLYGPGDNFHPVNSHVLPAFIRRFHEAVENGLDEVQIWGTGTPRREFMHVEDMAAASLHVMNLEPEIYRAHTKPMMSHVNVGVGEDIALLDLAQLVARVTGYEGAITTDPSKPDGPPRKLLDVSLLKRLGWTASVALEDGVRQTYQWYLENRHLARK